MIIRIPQREEEDCAICAVAMVMGPPYDYERVSADSQKYPKVSTNGKFPAWWEAYLHDEGFETCYCYFDGLYALPNYGGTVTALLGMDIPSLRKGHIVAVDEKGVVDPANGAPAHVELGAYVFSRLADGVVFHSEFLAVKGAEQYAPPVDLASGATAQDMTLCNILEEKLRLKNQWIGEHSI